MSYLVIRRPAAHLRRQCISLTAQVIAACLFWWWYAGSGGTFDLVFAVIFTLWAAFILRDIIMRPLRFAETAEGFSAYAVFGTKHIRWDQLRAIADGDTFDRMLFLAFEKEGGKESYVGISRKSLTDDGMAQVLDLIARKRPGLKRFEGGKVQDEAAVFPGSEGA